MVGELWCEMIITISFTSHHRHTQEVTGVAWNPSDLCTLATASDDQSVRIWRVDRERGNVNTRPNVASLDERLGGSPLEERHAESAPQESSSEAVEAPSAPVRSTSFNDQPETPTTGRQVLCNPIEFERSYAAFILLPCCR